MPKTLSVAGEVDSWCTRCRLTLNHRIVSMKASKPHQVECLTCQSTHLWRPKPPGEKPGAAPGGSERPRASSGPPRLTRAAAALVRHEQSWEQAIATRGIREFKSYSVGETFEEGDFVRHKKFGDGVVARVIDAHKVEVLFRDEARTLAQAMA